MIAKTVHLSDALVSQFEPYSLLWNPEVLEIKVAQGTVLVRTTESPKHVKKAFDPNLYAKFAAFLKEQAGKDNFLELTLKGHDSMTIKYSAIATEGEPILVLRKMFDRIHPERIDCTALYKQVKDLSYESRTIVWICGPEESGKSLISRKLAHDLATDHDFWVITLDGNVTHPNIFPIAPGQGPDRMGAMGRARRLHPDAVVLPTLRTKEEIESAYASALLGIITIAQLDAPDFTSGMDIVRSMGITEALMKRPNRSVGVSTDSVHPVKDRVRVELLPPSK